MKSGATPAQFIRFDPCRNIPRCDCVSRTREAAADTRKFVPCRTVGSRYKMTDRAFLGSISRINADQGHTSYGGLVVDILPELIEAPVMLFAPLSLWNRYPLSYARKIFQHDSRRGVYGLRNQLLRDAMINVSMEPSFFTGKLLQMTFCAICSTALKIGFEGLHHCIDNNDPYTYRTFGIPPHPEGRGLLPN